MTGHFKHMLDDGRQNVLKNCRRFSLTPFLTFRRRLERLKHGGQDGRDALEHPSRRGTNWGEGYEPTRLRGQQDVPGALGHVTFDSLMAGLRRFATHSDPRPTLTCPQC